MSRRTHWTHRLTALAASLLLCAAALRAQAEPTEEAASALVRVEVIVTAVAGGSVFLDKGRDAGIQPGDVVELRPLGGELTLGVVRSVSRSSARVELPPDAPDPAPGDRGEVLVPASRFGEVAVTPEGEELPPPRSWSSEEVGYDTQRPLLAEAQAKSAAEQGMSLTGRAFFQFTGNWDEQNDNEFQLWRTGVDVRAENPFGLGGVFQLEAEGYRRSLGLGAGDDSSTTRGQLDRASYTWGGTRERPERWQVGRFLQNAFPELGLLDGVEYSRRTDSGDTWGASAGAMPLPAPGRSSGDDTQVAVYWRSAVDEDSRLDLGVAYQNTWHRGSQDRNLLVGSLDARATDEISVHGLVLVDHYGAGDDLKDDGFELTEAHLNARWTPGGDGGVGVHATHLRWPELMREEFGELSDMQVTDGRLTRIGLDGWRRVTQALRLNARVDTWTDQNDSGESGSVRATLRDVLWERGDVSAELFVTRGASTEGRGVRLAARRTLEDLGSLGLLWETTRFEQETLFFTDGDVDQQALRATLDADLGDGRSLSLYAERRDGDDTDSYNLGVFLQERF